MEESNASGVSARKDDTPQDHLPIGRPLLNRWNGCDERSRQPTLSPALLMEVAIMQRDISKLCADTLRTLAIEKYDTKLKAAHAHELVAAYFGYRSKNALLADKEHPISALAQAELVVLMPDEFLNKRRMNLEGLSSDLPDNSVLCEAILSALVTNRLLMGPFPPVGDFEKLAISLLRRSPQYDAAFPFHSEVPLDHFVAVRSADNLVRLTVTHAYAPQSEESLAEGRTTISLPRVAGRIGFGRPELMPERWSGGMRKTLESLGVRL